MDDASGSQAEIQVSPEERRFLKRFFRRQMLPWAGALLVISLATTWALHGGGDPALEARTAAALAQLRSENQRLGESLTKLQQQLEARQEKPAAANDELRRQVEETRRNVRLIEARIDSALEDRLKSIEERLGAQGPAPVREAGAAPPPEAAAWDVSAILDRLYALEMRQEKLESRAPSDDTSTARIEERLMRLERRLAPAAPTP